MTKHSEMRKFWLVMWYIFLATLLILLAGPVSQVSGIVKQPKEYGKAYAAAKKDGGVLAVLLTMKNCPGCVDIANDKQYGEAVLKTLPHFVKVKVEDYPDLAAHLAKDNMVVCPQLCCYWHRKGKWIIEYYIGANDIKKLVKERIKKKRTP